MSKVLSRSLACLTPGCKKIVKHRGNCQACDIRNRVNVKAGKTTWEELIAAGLVFPPKRKGSGYQGLRKDEE